MQDTDHTQKVEYKEQEENTQFFKKTSESTDSLSKEPKSKKRGEYNTRPKVIRCEFCFETFTKCKDRGHEKFDRHMTRHKIENFSCDCDVELNTKTEKERHVKVEHFGWYSCPKCLTCIKRRDKLEEHFKIHEKLEVNKSLEKVPVQKNSKEAKETNIKVCDLCGENVSSGSVNLHKLLKHDVKLSECDLCEKISRIQQNLSFTNTIVIIHKNVNIVVKFL